MTTALQTYLLSRMALATAVAAGLSMHTAEAQTHKTSASPAISYALIAQDNVPLRAAPQASATQQAQLWQGELVEVRGQRMEFAQVWDRKRERGGFVRMNQLRSVSFSAGDTDGLMSVLQFIKDAPGSEGLAFGYGAAWLKAASPSQANSATGAQVLDAMAVAAERLARRASSNGLSKSAQEAAAAQLDAAQRYSLRFESIQGDGVGSQVTVCYDGELFARLLAMPAASGEHRARAALALSRSDCEDPALAIKNPIERSKNDEWRAAVLDKVDTLGLPAHLANRVHLRRAQVWSTLAYDRSRNGKTSAVQAAQRSLDALASINKTELPEEEQALLNDAVMRVNASRWAAVEVTSHNTDPAVVTTAGTEAGQTCVSLVLGHSVVAKRCLFTQPRAQCRHAGRTNAGRLAGNVGVSQGGRHLAGRCADSCGSQPRRRLC
jgi:hypothetical protein